MATQPGKSKKIPIISIILTIISIAGALLFVILTVIFWKQTSPSIYWQIFFMLEFLLITMFTRTFSLSRVFGFFLIGAGLGPLMALILSYPIQLIFGSHNSLTRDIFVPIIEELVKPLPLIAMIFWPHSRLRHAGSLSDFLISGAALGGGFNFAEDLLRGWDWNKMLASRGGPHIGFVYLFPTMDVQTGYGRDVPMFPNAYLGHGAATVLICLCLGLMILNWKSRARLLLIPLPLLAWLWVTWDHIFFNLSSGGALKGVQDMLSLILGLHGQIAPWGLFLLTILTVGLDAGCLIRFYHAHPESGVKLDRLALFHSFPPRRWLFDFWLWLKAGQLRRIMAYANRQGEPIQKLMDKALVLRRTIEQQ
jgi:hypothetical protein